MIKKGERTYDNWVQINANGFGNDRNRYAWSMAVFQPEGSTNPQLYVGTTNDFDAPPKPEIWRYDPKAPLSERWTKEFDCNHRGFRKMKVFNKKLYVGTHRDPPIFRFFLFFLVRWGCNLYRYDGREYNGEKWVNVIDPGFGTKCHSVRSMEVYKEQLYVGTSNIVEGGQIWRTRDNVTVPQTQRDWEMINNSGFGKGRQNTGIFSLKEFNDFFWAGTANGLTGCEIWRYDGKNWENVIEGGFNNKHNIAAMNMEVFKGKLYVGTFNPYCGCQIWRYPANTPSGWEKVVSGGFENPENVYVWSMKVYEDNGTEYLYVGTFNGGGYIVEAGLSGPKGAELWRTATGNCNEWEKVVENGFDDKCNYGIRTLEIFDKHLYAGTARPPMILSEINSRYSKRKRFVSKRCHQGCEVWKYPKDEKL